MQRWRSSLVLIVGAGLILTACGGNATNLPPVATVNQAPPTAENGIVSTADVPTSTPASNATGQVLPPNTLVLAQLEQFVAQLPDSKLLTLSPDRIPPLGSPDGRYGVLYAPKDGAVDLTLGDYSAIPATTKAIPSGTGLTSPSVIWREDSTGFAFSDFPAPDKVAQAKKVIYYYDLASGQSQELINESQTPNSFPIPVAFSPNNTYLIYLLTGGAETGSVSYQVVLYDLNTKQKTPLSLGQAAFGQWLADSSGFLATAVDPQSGASALVLYRLNALASPQTITPPATTDVWSDISPDGKFLAVVSAAAGTAQSSYNIFIMGVDGSNRRQLTQFNDPQQSITALVWGNDGIYYSVFNGEDFDAVWRMDLDGKNAKQVAQGTLQRIVGTR
jgi:Tol biopolymer transport system component